MLNFLIVDDHEMTRFGVRLLLTKHFSFNQIDEAASGNAALGLVKEHKYDLVILDMNMPGTDANQLIDNIVRVSPATRVLVFSMNKEEVFAKKLLAQGVKGYIEKAADKEELLSAIKTVLNGHVYLSQDLKRGIISSRKEAVMDNPFSTLSNKELEVMSHIIKGYGITYTANLMNLSNSTIATHKARILSKLGLQNIYELIELARLHKLA